MSVVNLHNLSLYYADREIFKDLSLQISPKDRLGLVGRNGTGKTSLLRILAGVQSQSSGAIRLARGARVGYLPQDISEVPQKTVLASVIESVPGKTALEDTIREAEAALSSETGPERQMDLAGELANLHERLEHYQTLFAPHLAEEILSGLGFPTRDFFRPLAEMSGGWRMRAALAGLLYQRPDLLLMDEPTNHLDVPSVRWLGEFLKGARGALMLVCHDREFLNEQINRVVSFETEGVRQYKGDYESYLVQRAEEEKVLERQAKNQEQKVKDAMKFVERFRYKSTKARQAQSKIKMLDKLDLIGQHKKPKAVDFHFPKVPESGRDVVRLEELGKAYGDHVLFKGQTKVVQRGERVAVIGPNGAGKTTLLKIIAQELAPDSGRLLFGHNVSLSYYAQHQAEQLDPAKSVVEEVYASVPSATVTFVRGVCGAFLFSGDEVDKPTGVLSGGERARVALAKLLVKPGNLLLMDEPTNHLDILSSEILIEALREYNGTLVFVSHNRAFVNRLATKVWDLRGGAIIEYPGNLKEYFEHLDAIGESPEETPARRRKAEEPRPGKDPDKESRKAQKRAEAEKRLKISRELGPLKKKAEATEREVAEVERRIGEVEQALADPEVFEDHEKSRPLFEEYGKLKKRLETLEAKWEKEQTELEAREKAMLEAE